MKYQFDIAQDLSPEEATSLLSDMRKLLESRAWKVIDALLHDHYVSGMAAIVATPLKTTDAALEQEYEKGKLAEVCILRDLPNSLIEHFTYLAQLQESNQEEI